ncbi:ribosylnicotinamide kinase [Coemansia spiralis]|nr:ribosylnicotinamide kinase [Coemansia spiralis]
MPGVVVFGLSGPSCSGKTTIALHLARLFPRAAVVHQDNFYRPDSQIPLHPTARIQDWDCPESFDMQAMAHAIDAAREALAHPTEAEPHSADGGDQTASQWANPPADVDQLIPPAGIASICSAMLDSLGVNAASDIPFAVVVVDGILLFYDSADGGACPGSACDAGALVYAQRDTLRQRREARTVYATKEGIWVDPPGYFDAIVWPNFTKHHRSLLAALPQVAGGQAAEGGGGGRDWGGSRDWAGKVVVCSSDEPAETTLRVCVESIVHEWHSRQNI